MKNGEPILWNTSAIFETFKISWQMGRHLMKDDSENLSKARSHRSVQWLNSIRPPNLFLDKMTSIVLGNINAVYTLACAHPPTIVPCARSERTIFVIRALFFPHAKTIGDVCIDDLVIRSALQLSTVRVESLPIEVQLTAALVDFFVVAVGVSRTLLQGLLGRWALALSFRLNVFTSLDGP